MSTRSSSNGKKRTKLYVALISSATTVIVALVELIGVICQKGDEKPEVSVYNNISIGEPAENYNPSATDVRIEDDLLA